MEDGTRDPKSSEEESFATLPQGVFAETIEHAVEAARFGVDTVLLVPGNRSAIQSVVEYVIPLAADGVRIKDHSVTIWRWVKSGGTLLIASSMDGGSAAYRRLHPSMNIYEARNALEFVSARKE